MKNAEVALQQPQHSVDLRFVFKQKLCEEFLTGKNYSGGASAGGADTPFAGSSAPSPSLVPVGRPGDLGTGSVGISTLFELPHPVTATSGMARRAIIRNEPAFFSMNLIQSGGNRDGKKRKKT